MSNFRAERVFVMLDSPIQGFDHVKAIDPERLCDAFALSEGDSNALDLDPLYDFSIAAGDRSWQPREKPRWRAAESGLKAVRGLLAHYQSQLARGQGSAAGVSPSALPRIVETLRQLEAVLDKADTYDRRFCFAVKDLA